MPVERPTFSESWYRVAKLRPRLRSTVQVHRQHFRGRPWHVIQDPVSNQFFRLNEPAYGFVGLLDGHRTVEEAWRIAADQLGDAAPTQGEAISLLGQLYTSNLLHADCPPDAEGLFARYRKRRRREVQGYLSNFLFARVPLLDPDRFLNWTVGLFGKLFTPVGFLLWLGLVAAGVYFLIDSGQSLVDPASRILDLENLPLLYACFAIVKIVHEFGHAYACKRFGRVTGSGGEVHVMGVMFLVFMPLPYVDASSSWAFRSKRQRAIVGAAGMVVELAVAAVAAIIWARTGQGAPWHKIAYNVMFIASLSTVLFNANPLVRFDGYYILSDLLEIPNLAQRSRQQLYYLIRRYLWRVRTARSPAAGAGEKTWLIFYAIASTIYRVWICVRILLFLGDHLPKELFFLAPVLGAGAAVAWALVPLGKFIKYLATGGELSRVRGWAAGSTLIAAVLAIGGLSLVPAPYYCTIETVVEPKDLAVVHAAEDGFVQHYLATDKPALPGGPPLLSLRNPSLVAERDRLLAESRELATRRSQALTREPAAAQALAEQLAALQTHIEYVNRRLADLELSTSRPGTWIAPQIDDLRGAYVHRGDKLGMVADLTAKRLRGGAQQEMGALLKAEAYPQVELRVRGRPDMRFAGTIDRILQAGTDELASAALGYAAGGSVETDLSDRSGTKAAEPFFEVRVFPDAAGDAALLTGQRVMVRFRMPDRPLAVQWYRSILQLFQRRSRS